MPKKRRKVTRTRSPTRYDIVSISKKNRLRRTPPAALRGFRIQMTVQNLFTTISSKTCTEHVHNLSPAVPSMLWCPFHKITGVTLTLLEKVLKSQDSEENSEESRLFTGANLVLRPA